MCLRYFHFNLLKLIGTKHSPFVFSRNSATNPVFRMAFLTRQQFVFSKIVPSLYRATPSIQSPVCDGVVSLHHRQYRSMPTHGIGRWRHLVPQEEPKKRREKLQMKPLVEETDTAYGTLNVKVWGHDMTLVEHYAQYIHNLCNRLQIKVAECYALPTKTTEVLLMPEQGTKIFIDAVLKTHERVVQLSFLDTTLCTVFLEVLLKNQPEGVQLSVQQHTEADFQARFKARPEMENLMAKINQ
ncbi:39S ribosomal protein L48, mitochondrial [Thalassophryne amazonica]|uniref:39S ribosomal protein L48, mitochondrial n=1 Tax=Thalassophryne amazonica TaxID=390379 RepID=UPI001470A2FE|nr:39S ribosomal protein L48, mitochondrial [Thalassophryne amazonica]